MQQVSPVRWVVRVRIESDENNVVEAKVKCRYKLRPLLMATMISLPPTSILHIHNAHNSGSTRLCSYHYSLSVLSIYCRNNKGSKTEPLRSCYTVYKDYPLCVKRNRTLTTTDTFPTGCKLCIAPQVMQGYHGSRVQQSQTTRACWDRFCRFPAD